jgi:hypothetical protein
VPSDTAPAPWWKRFGAFALALMVGGVAGYVIYDIFHSQSRNEVVAPDTPPGEYIYLDRDRVHSYLSQIVDGLADSEKRTLAETEDLSAEIKAGAAGLGGKRSQSSSFEAQIRPTPADRFYLLLRLLRDGTSKQENGDSAPWLFDLHANAADGQRGYDAACQIREGDFVRIHEAHLLLSPYAAVLPKATYAVLNRRTPTGSVAQPDQKLFAPHNRAQKRAIRRYQRLLGRDPRLPFVVRTTWAVPHAAPSTRMTFFIPARYSSLRNEPSLISGTLTVVGKVVYRNLSRRVAGSKGDRIDCGDVPDLPNVPKTYLDRQTVATFVPALNINTAPKFVFDNLRFKVGSVVKDVTANMTVTPPLMVVVPIAMFQ